MRLALVCVPQAAQAAGPDLTRYFVACTASIALLLAALWCFRRFVAGRLRERAARRSLQVLDVLPLSSKHKLVVVRCYDRSFVLGLGEKEVRAIAELDSEAVHPPEGAPGAFGKALERELEVPSARAREARGSAAPGGVLA